MNYNLAKVAKEINRAKKGDVLTSPGTDKPRLRAFLRLYKAGAWILPVFRPMDRSVPWDTDLDKFKEIPPEKIEVGFRKTQ